MWGNLRPYLIISLIWLGILMIVDHRGEFPLIDDWAYAHGVSDLLHDGFLKISDWVAMTQVAHLYLGYVWALIFGFSLQHLRELTMIIGYLGSLLMFATTRRIVTGYGGHSDSNTGYTRVGNTYHETGSGGHSDGSIGSPPSATVSQNEKNGQSGVSLTLILVASLILVVNPLWIYLSHTFMTDIPFTVLFILLIFLMTTAVKSSSEKRFPLVWIPIFMMGIAIVLIRQTGIGIGLSFLGWVLLLPADYRNRLWKPALALALIQILSLVAYESVMASIGALSTRYHGAGSLSWIFGRDWWMVRAAYYVSIQLQYLGFFLLPLLPFVIYQIRKESSWFRPGGVRYLAVLVCLIVAIIAIAVRGDILMNPRYTHLMQYDTVGHVMTIDFTYEKLEFSRVLYPLWVVIHALGLINLGGILYLGLLRLRLFARDGGNHIRKGTLRLSPDPLVWVLLILAGYTVFISVGQFVFDRYLLLHLPLAIWVSTRILFDGNMESMQQSRYFRSYVAASILLLSLSFVFATTGVRDSFEWNRVRFGALEQLEMKGISPHEIDGGAEYNSWKRTAPLQPLRMHEKSWWYVDGDEWAIAFDAMPGYRKVTPHPFRAWYGLRQDTLWVIKRYRDD